MHLQLGRTQNETRAGPRPEQGSCFISPAWKTSLSSCPALRQDLMKPFIGEKHKLISDMRNPHFGARRIPGGPAWPSSHFGGDFAQKHRWLYSLGSLVFAFLPLFPLSFSCSQIFLALSVSVLMIFPKLGDLNCFQSRVLRHQLKIMMMVMRVPLSISEHTRVPGAVPSSAGTLSLCIFITAPVVGTTIIPILQMRKPRLTEASDFPAVTQLVSSRARIQIYMSSSCFPILGPY